MDLPKEGLSTVRPPLLDGSNYPYWNVQMRAFIKSIDEKAWLSVVNGYYIPTTTVVNVTTPKTYEQWDALDYANANWKSKALNTIYSALTPEEFRRVSNCETAKAT